ncbi:hypothetical protein [Paenibacillus sp. GP183]|uniref:hypothetical protein n=1 Tax=Paenibacillus sp. GP183 TaxID=1882751 RepID=UPI0008978BAC|nr:hypothetical protein [Paenibacillus sp. GP183]SEB92874.1 hypothetical protein SAMN05443246_2382 [Paenibacillus sp. GP183]
MKKQVWRISIVIIIVIIGVSVWFVKQIPKINGKPVYDVTISDPQGKNVVVHWLPNSNKNFINTLSRALDLQQKLEPINQNPANYWIHTRFKDGNDADFLLWLEKNQPASFVSAFRGRDGIMTYGGIQSSYRIPDTIRNELYDLIKK